MSGVRFTRESAKRIADVVRTVELGDRDAAGLRFGSAVGDAGRKTFRIATFSGAWAIGATKTVTYKYQTSTPNTAVVTNLFFSFQGSTSTSQAYDCAIARDGTAWYLIDLPTETVSVTILTGVTLTTAGLEFTRASVTVQASATLTITTIGTTAC